MLKPVKNMQYVNINSILNSKVIANNVDTIINRGCYDVNPNTQGTLPLNGGYALLFVRTTNTTWIYQDLIYTDTTNLRHYHRMKINDREWTDWNEYVTDSDLKPLLVSDANLATENRAYRLSSASLNIPWSGIGCIINTNKYDNFITQTTQD